MWCAVAGYEGLYEVSRHGQVKSLARRVKNGNGTRKVRERILKHNTCQKRCTVVLSKGGRSKQKRFFVHFLVARAFIPNLDGKPEVNHIDLDPFNNNADNLEWTTHAENMAHAKANGAMWAPKGEDSPRCTLTNAKVIKARKMYATGKWTVDQVAQKLNAGKAAIYKAIRRFTWKHI